MQGFPRLGCGVSQAHLNIKLDHPLGTQEAAVLKVHMCLACSHADDTAGSAGFRVPHSDATRQMQQTSGQHRCS